MRAVRLIVGCLAMLCVTMRVSAQAPAAAQPVVNTWSARSAGGMLLVGTFTVVPDEATGTVTGTWTLNGAQGQVLASGGWSAAKMPGEWSGAWRSIVAGSNREYAGTWTAALGQKDGTKLPQMFLRSLHEIVTGGWRSGGNGGAWSIRLGGG